MRSVMRSPTGWNVASNLTCLFIIIGGLLTGSVAFAQNDVVLDAGCVLDQPIAPNGLNCTANDTTLSSPTITVIEPCNFPGDIALLDVTVDITVGAQTRYDLGVWISIDGDPNLDGSESGECAVLSVPNNILHVDQVTTTLGDGDYCGDVFNVAPDGIVVPPTETAHVLDAALGTFPVICDDSDGDGQIDIPVIVAWKQQANPDCAVSNDAVPGTASKCTRDDTLALDIPIPGRITVDKVTEPADDTVFNFLLEGPASPNEGGFDGSEIFTLNDADTPFDTGTAFEGGVLEGIYSVTEDVAPGYILTDVTCTGSEGAEDPAAIDLAPGETVNCVFTNTLDSATITVVKNTLGGNGQFAFNWFGPTTNGGVLLDTGLINTDSDTIVTTETGTFSLTEIQQTGWALSNAACVNDDDGAGVGTWDNVDTITGIDLSPGDAVTCTFTNQAIGTVALVKNTVGGDGSFDFVTDVPGLGTNITTSGGTGQTSASNVPAGTYSIAETVPAGWQLDSATCSDGSPPDALILTQGETVTCTFVDIRDGEIIVDKVTLPAASPQSFLFNLSGTFSQAFSLTDAATPYLSGNLTPGTFSVTEFPEDGWVLTDATCTGMPGNDDEDPAAIDLEPGEVVTCVFTNTQNGSIEVIKSLAGTGPAVETFDFTSSFNGDFQLTGDAATTGPIEVAPGTGYTVSEIDPTANGWANTGASCGDGSVPGTDIVVSPGEAVVCTFINTPLGSATIIKDTVGGNGVFGFTGDAPIGPFSLDTTDQFTATTGDLFNFILTAGIYDVTEDNIPSGFTLTNIECSDDSLTDVGTATASMDVQLAETVACTFTNTADGTLIIRKETIPDGVDQSFDFTGDAAGTLRDFSTFGEEIVVTGLPNTYTSAETVPEGWAITDINCEGQVQSGVTYGEVDVSVDLAAGETVICTFENSAQGSITIEKFTQGGLGAFQFNSDLGPFQLDTLTNGNPDSVSFSGLASGSYMFSEVVPSNWTLSDIQCSGGGESTIITIGGEGDFDPGDQGVTIDLADGDAVVCTFVNDADGSISVTKITDPAGSLQGFDFTGDITATLTDGQSSSQIMVPPGGYAVTEGVVPGWDVTDISCSDDDSTGTGSTANFVVAPGEVVNCTFTNTVQRGTIIVDKVTDPAGSTQQFIFTPNYGDGGFILTDADPAFVVSQLLPTSEFGAPYSVSEAATDGWDLTSATCDDGSDPGAIDLAPGETVTCTFVNTIQRGQIIVDKVTDPAGSAQSFDFTLTGTDVNQAFSLTDEAAPYNSGDLLPTSENGAYNVTETLPAGWTGSGACSDGSDPGAVDLAPAEVVTCTFTNTIQPAQIIVDKVTDPAGSTQSFDFTLTGTDVNQAFSLTDEAAPYNSGDLLPTSENGAYNVTETLPAGWTGSGVCSDGSDPGAVDLAPAEVVTCTFTNTIQPAQIIVDKVTDPAGSTQSFDFTLTGTDVNQAFSLTDEAAPYNSGDLLPTSENGAYNVTETLPAGWTGSGVCSDGSDPGAVDLAPAEVVTCTFTNTIERGQIIVDKVTDPAGSTQSFDFTLTGTDVNQAFSLTDEAAPYNSGDLLPTSENGAYNVTETLPAGWTGSGVCSDGSDPGAVDLAPAEVVTCTFTNTIQRGNIIVQKVTDPDTSTEAFGFVTNYGDPFVLMNGEQNDSGELLPTSEGGTYSVIEDDELGWELTSAICNDGSDPTAIDLAPGETVTCVFTNTSSASVTIVKELINLADDSYCFEVTSSEINDGFCIQTQGGTGEERFEGVATGFYSFSEVTSGTYAVISNECSNGDNADELVIGPGDDVTCTFVNVPVTPVPVNNPLALLALILMMLAAGWYFRPAGLRRF